MKINWLHVSDFHINESSYDRDVVQRSLVESVRVFKEKGRNLDLIFATGDIAFSGKTKQYELATEFFDALLEAAGLDRRRLFVVPGNHDVDRRLGVGLARTLNSREESDSYFDPSVAKVHLTQKQSAFVTWYDSYFNGIRNFSKDSTCSLPEVITVQDMHLEIVLLNSSLFSQGDDDHEKLWLGRRCLDRLNEKNRHSQITLSIALIHHPLDWLNGLERANIKTKLFEYVDVILRGHLHETDVETVINSTDSVLQLAAGATYQTRQWPNRAMFAAFDGEYLTIFPIRYEDQPRELWTVDPSLFPYEPGNEKTFVVPRLQQKLPARPLQRTLPLSSRVTYNAPRRSTTIGNNLQLLSLGDPTAEADKEFLFKRGCFLQTDLYASCVRLTTPLFIVGRRGTGKTAMSLALARAFENDSSILATTIVPQPAYFAHAKSLARLLAEKTSVNWEFLFSSLWATTLRSEWARQLIGYYKVRDSAENDLTVLRDFVKVTAPDPHESPTARLSRYLTEILTIISKSSHQEDVVGLLNNALLAYRAERVQSSLARVATASNVRIVTIVDSLDENWDGSNTSAELISGLLIQAASDFPAIGAITFALIRENMYRRVSNICPRWDRIEGYFYQVTWSEEQIRDLILRRIDSQLNADHKSWNMVFEPQVQDLPSLQYIVSRTQFKPREVILFCKYAIDAANRHRSPLVRGVDVLEAERRYSENRLKDLINEYQDSLPELRAILDLFLGKRQVVPLDEFLRLLEEFVTTGRYLQVAPRISLIYPTKEGIFDLLLGIGFVGVRLIDSDSFLFKYYGEQGNVFTELADIQEVSIHPAFEQALGLVKGKSRVPAKEAHESEIVAASMSISTRMSSAYERAAAVIGQLRDIPPGAGGFKRYEDLIESAISFAFQGFLDNARLERIQWGGEEIREIVFDNTGETNFFTMARREHGAITFRFACKNQINLEISDFHQMETRLVKSGGDLGFLCYRSDRREPVRNEIMHLREIFLRDSNHRRVVMLISDGNLIQLLEQRMKGKLDRFMSKMYTRYRKLYLS